MKKISDLFEVLINKGRFWKPRSYLKAISFLARVEVDIELPRFHLIVISFLQITF